jgi:hypothetical protein
VNVRFGSKTDITTPALKPRVVATEGTVLLSRRRLGAGQADAMSAISRTYDKSGKVSRMSKGDREA